MFVKLMFMPLNIWNINKDHAVYLVHKTCEKFRLGLMLDYTGTLTCVVDIIFTGVAKLLSHCSTRTLLKQL